MKKTTLFSCLLFSSLALANEPYDPLELDLDKLMATDVQATSAMKRAQSAFDTASSIYVLSKEQIANANVTSIPEALKLVPGIVVRQLDNNQWAITTRGLASRYSSKLLVMIDGQSFYTPKFATVYWEALNIPLYDIERIEVMRGHGGILWGNNANNGVVNIITKNSLDSRGNYAELMTGKNTNAIVNLRHGNDLFNNLGSYKVYTSVKNIPASDYGTTINAIDESKQQSIGARFDLILNDAWSALVQADYTDSVFGQNYQDIPDENNISLALPETVQRHDGHIMARLDNRISSSANQMFQLSWVKQQGKDTFVQENFNTYDFDYQMNFVYQTMQFDWGVNYRYNDITLAQSRFLTSDNNISDLEQYGLFIQGQFNFLNDELAIIVGNKFDYNDLTKWENQPLLRVKLQPSANQNLWAAVSRSVRAPSLIEFDNNGQLGGTQLHVLTGLKTGIDKIDNYYIDSILNGNDQIQAEKYTSYELGYRYKASNWSIDLSSYHTHGNNVGVVDTTFNLAQFEPLVGLLQQQKYDDAYNYLKSTQLTFDLVSTAQSTTRGYETLFSYAATKTLRTELGYSYISFRYHLPKNAIPAVGVNSTTRQLFAKVNYTPVQNHTLFATLRNEQSDAYQSDNYTALDMSWSWQINTTWTASLIGKNLFAGKHLEFNNRNETYAIPNYINEDFSFKIKAKF